MRRGESDPAQCDIEFPVTHRDAGELKANPDIVCQSNLAAL
jgi:hypothetical protein